MKFFVFFCLLLLSLTCLRADEAVGSDPDLPQPLDPVFAETLVTNSPFTRFVNLEESLQLTGIAYVEGRPVATILNTMTKERFLVFEEPNSLGWRLLAATAGADLAQTQIEMMVGSEVITMHYNGPQGAQGMDARAVGKSRLANAASGKKVSGKWVASSLLGEHGREMYASLSPEARGKFKDLMKSQMEKKPDMTPEQSSAYAQKVFVKIKETDHSSSGGVTKPPKSSKPTKKKQGA